MTASSQKVDRNDYDSQTFSKTQREVGYLNDKSVVPSNNQTSQAWFVIAIAIGIFVFVGGGSFCCIGLLQSYGLISLPTWIAPIIGTIGHSPHSLSLWIIAGVSIVGGGSCIIFGAYKIHKQESTAHQKVIDLYCCSPHFEHESDLESEEEEDEYSKLRAGYYYTFWSENHPNMTLFVVRTHAVQGGNLIWTDWLTDRDAFKLECSLKKRDYLFM